MSKPMSARKLPDKKFLTKELTIANKLGIHARPAALFVKTANRFACDIFVEKDGEKVNGKSIMGLMMLAAGPGSKLTIHADGPDAGQAVHSAKLHRSTVVESDAQKASGGTLKVGMLLQDANRATGIPGHQVARLQALDRPLAGGSVHQGTLCEAGKGQLGSGQGQRRADQRSDQTAPGEGCRKEWQDQAQLGNRPDPWPRAIMPGNVFCGQLNGITSSGNESLPARVSEKIRRNFPGSGA